MFICSIPGDVNFDYLLKLHMPDFSIVKSLFFPLGLTSILQGNTLKLFSIFLCSSFKALKF